MSINLVRTHYSKIVLEDSCLKHRTRKVKNLPKISQISLHLDIIKNQEILGITILELLSFHRPSYTQNHKTVLHLNIKKGLVVGCRVNLRKKPMYDFLQTFLFESLPASLNTKKSLVKNNFFRFKMYDNFVREEALAMHMHLEPIKTLDLVIETKGGSPDFLQGFRIPADKIA
jgi:ribosomal protein L5